MSDGFPTILGRTAELREINTRISLAERGVGGLIVLVGEPGIGKTALAEHATVLARERGFTVGWSACRQTAAGPLHPWRQLFAQLSAPGAAPDLVVADGDHDRGRALQADRIVAWLHARTATPVLLVIDDLQWADEATLSALRQVESVLAAMPVTVLVAHRPSDTTTSRPTAEAIADLRRHGSVLELAGLDVDDTAELFTTLRGGSVSPQSARALQELTGGNPLFAREAARALPRTTLDGPIDVSRLAVPATVRALATERLTALSVECRSVLEALSTAGDDVGLGLLAAASGCSTERLLDVLDEAIEAGLAEVRGNEARFRHALLRTAVYESLSSATRARLHDRIGHELAAQRQRGLPVEAAALAHHFGRAAPLGNTQASFRYSLEAAADAISLLAFDLAASRLEQALALLALDPDLGDRLALKLDVADALAASGDVTKARTLFHQVAGEAARDGGDRHALGRAALGFSGGLTGIEVVIGDAEVCQVLERAAAALDDDDVLGARILGRLSTALSYRSPLAERAGLASQARRRALSGGDPTAIAETLGAWCDVVAGPAHVEARRKAATEIIRRSAQLGDAAVEALGRRLLVEALLEAGDLRTAQGEVSRFERTTARLGRSEYLWYPPLWRASLALACGQMEARARARTQLEALVGAGHGRNVDLLAHVQQGAMALDLADPKLAAASLAGIVAVATVDDVQLQTTGTLLRALDGDLDGARAAIDACTASALAAEADSEWPATMMQLAETIVAVGGHPSAEAVRNAIEPFGATWVVEGIGASIRGPLDRVLGSLAALEGDRQAADAHFAAAGASAARAGAVLIGAVVDHERGRALDDRRSLDRAAVVWRRVGATHRLAEVEALSHPRSVPRATSAPTRNRFVLEGDVWSITYDGHTCALPDRKGLQDLARLVAEPGRELAALDLMTSGGSLLDRGTGPTIDARARDAYRARLVEIETELDDADDDGDADRSAHLVAEQEALIAGLRSAYGLGGRLRATGRSAERARTAVRARIRDALRRIDAVHPALGRHLGRSVRTGNYCLYQPDPPVDWVTESASHIV